MILEAAEQKKVKQSRLGSRYILAVFLLTYLLPVMAAGRLDFPSSLFWAGVLMYHRCDAEPSSAVFTAADSKNVLLQHFVGHCSFILFFSPPEDA